MPETSVRERARAAARMLRGDEVQMRVLEVLARARTKIPATTVAKRCGSPAAMVEVARMSNGSGLVRRYLRPRRQGWSWVHCYSLTKKGRRVLADEDRP